MSYKIFNLSGKLLMIWFVYFISYNAYFGFNFISESELETQFDNIAIVSVKIILFMYFYPLFDIYTKYVRTFYNKDNE